MVFVVCGASFHCVSASCGHRCTAGVDWDHQVASWPRRYVVRAPAHAVLMLVVSWCGHVGVMWTAKGESDIMPDVPQDWNPLVQIKLSQRMLVTTPEWSQTKTQRPHQNLDGKRLREKHQHGVRKVPAVRPHSRPTTILLAH